jgi:hypothetical protein
LCLRKGSLPADDDDDNFLSVAGCLSVHTVRICVLKLNEASDMNKPCLIEMPDVTSVWSGF